MDTGAECVCRTKVLALCLKIGVGTFPTLQNILRGFESRRERRSRCSLNTLLIPNKIPQQVWNIPACNFEAYRIIGEIVGIIQFCCLLQTLLNKPMGCHCLCDEEVEYHIKYNLPMFVDIFPSVLMF